VAKVTRSIVYVVLLDWFAHFERELNVISRGIGPLKSMLDRIAVGSKLRFKKNDVDVFMVRIKRPIVGCYWPEVRDA